MKERQFLVFDPVLTDKYFKISKESEFVPKINFKLPEDKDNLEKFFATPEGKEFLSSFQKILDEIILWEKEHFMDASALEEFQKNYTSGSATSVVSYAIYRYGVPALQGILNLINAKKDSSTTGEALIPPATIIAALANLNMNLSVCGPGIYTHITDTFLTLQGYVNFSLKLIPIRRTLAEKCVLASIKKMNYMNPGVEIHYVNAILNIHSEMIGVDVVDDYYISYCNPDIIESLHKEFSKTINKFITAEAALDHFFSELNSTLLQSDIDKHRQTCETLAQDPSAKVNYYPMSIIELFEQETLNSYGVEGKEKTYLVDDVLIEVNGKYYLSWQANYVLQSSLVNRLLNNGYLDHTAFRKEQIGQYTVETYNREAKTLISKEEDLYVYFIAYSPLKFAYVEIKEGKDVAHKPFIPYCINQLFYDTNPSLLDFATKLHPAGKIEIFQGLKNYFSSTEYLETKNKEISNKEEELQNRKKEAALIQNLSLIINKEHSDVFFSCLESLPKAIARKLLADFDQEKLLDFIGADFKSLDLIFSILSAEDCQKLMDKLGNKFSNAAYFILAAENKHQNLINYFLNKNINPTTLYDEKIVKLKGGNTPLHFAAKNGDIELVNKLLLLKANPKQTNELGNTPLQEAIQSKYDTLNVVRILTSKSDVNLKNKQGFTTLHLAIIHKKLDVLDYLINEAKANQHQLTKDGYPLLHVAIWQENLAAIELLFKSNLKMLKSTKEGYDPLHYAVACGSNAKIFSTLISYGKKAGLDPNSLDKNGFSPLHLAVMKGDEQSIIALLNSTAVNIDLLSDEKTSFFNKMCRPMLNLAVRMGNEKIVNLLLEKGANPNVFSIEKLLIGWSKDHYSPLHLSIKDNHSTITKDLLNHGANPNLFDMNGYTAFQLALRNSDPEIPDLMLSKKADPHLLTKDGTKCNTLHLACMGGHVTIIEKLLELGIPMDGLNAHNQTPIEYAAAYGRTDILAIFLNKINTPELLKQYKPILLKAFDFAIGKGHLDVVKTLLEKNYQDTNMREAFKEIKVPGSSLIIEAVASAKFDVVKYLLDEGFDPNETNSQEFNFGTLKRFSKLIGKEIEVVKLEAEFGLAGLFGFGIVEVIAMTDRIDIMQKMHELGKFHKPRCNVSFATLSANNKDMQDLTSFYMLLEEKSGLKNQNSSRLDAIEYLEKLYRADIKNIPDFNTKYNSHFLKLDKLCQEIYGEINKASLDQITKSLLEAINTAYLKFINNPSKCNEYITELLTQVKSLSQNKSVYHDSKHTLFANLSLQKIQKICEKESYTSYQSINNINNNS